MKYFIISQPKAGTYLGANLLQEFGLTFTHMHIGKHRFQKYDPNNLQAGRISSKQYTHETSLSESIKLISDNEFAVSHLPCTGKIKSQLKNFKILLLLRDIDSTNKSIDKWFDRTGRGIKGLSKEKYISKEGREQISNWSQNENVFVLDFYDMKDKNISKLNDLQVFLFNKIIIDSEVAILKALGKDSLTKSSSL